MSTWVSGGPLSAPPPLDMALIRRRTDEAGDVFVELYRPSDPPLLDPLVLAARLLGIQVGDPGPRLPEEACRKCWGEHSVWLGNGWGIRHKHSHGLLRGHPRTQCDHDCHSHEGWKAVYGTRVYHFREAEPAAEEEPGPAEVSHKEDC